MKDETRLIRVSVDLLQFIGTRAGDGRKLSYEWGEPVEHVISFEGGEEPVYVPTITATDDAMTREPVPPEMDTATDRFAVWKDDIWVEFDVADFAQQAASEVIYGPIAHSLSLCRKKPCDCWCMACEMHNGILEWRSVATSP